MQALVEALRPRAKEWIAVTDIDAPMRERRVAWAAAEAGRRGRWVLVNSVVVARTLPRIGALAVTIEEGSDRLRSTGIVGTVRLAALLEVSPGAIDDAVKLANAGASETEISAIALHEVDPGAAVRCSARARGLETPSDEESVAVDPTTDWRGRNYPPDWPGRIEFALRAGDLDVAAHWTVEWRRKTASIRSIPALARIHFFQLRVSEAQELLREVRDKGSDGTDDETRFELLRAE